VTPRTFVLTVDRPIARFDECAAHLDEQGIQWERFNGFDNQVCKLSPVKTFDFDRVGERIGPKHICATLSHYLVWQVMAYQSDDSFWLLEYDVRMMPDWRESYDTAMSVMPDDWDVVFLGSCCTAGRESRHIAGNVFEVKYPLCGHAIMYRRKALPVLLREHQDIYQPLDIAMMFQSLPKLRVYTILDPIVTQAGTYLPP
jgi:GR25 family glycosyltransferase involved in LPS biosynthesis